MTFPFNYKDVHHCQAVIIHCQDFRFHADTISFIKEEFNIKNYDSISLAGGSQAINKCNLDDGENIVTKSINVSCNLHKVDQIIIVNHRDCGGYGFSEAFNNDHDAELRHHQSELLKAKTKLNKYYPDQEVIMIYADLNDQQTEIDFQTIE